MYYGGSNNANNNISNQSYQNFDNNAYFSASTHAANQPSSGTNRNATGNSFINTHQAQPSQQQNYQTSNNLYPNYFQNQTDVKYAPPPTQVTYASYSTQNQNQNYNGPINANQQYSSNQYSNNTFYQQAKPFISDSAYAQQKDNLYHTSQQEQSKNDSAVRYVVHTVDMVDTLEGLSIQYGVPPFAIKKFNNLDSDNFYYLKEIKIPNPTTMNMFQPEYDEAELERIKQRQKISYLEGQLEKGDQKAARYYLEENDWDVDLALKQYKQEIEFEKQYAANQKKNNGLMFKKLI